MSKEVADAMRKAANHIEKNPDCYRFFAIMVPGDAPGETGCMIGWLGHFLGERRGTGITTVAQRIGLGSEVAIYDWDRQNDEPAEAYHTATGAVDKLRRLADHFDPAYSKFKESLEGITS
jgi:hypothetical protein